MNITNKGKKIVNIGELALLPGMTAPLPESYEGNPVVGFLIERGTLSCDQPFCSSAPKAPLIDDASDGADYRRLHYLVPTFTSQRTAGRK